MRVLYCRAQPKACEVDLSSPAVCAELLWVVIARGGGGIPEIGVVKLVEL